MNPKYVRAIVAGFLVAFVVGGGLGFTFVRLQIGSVNLPIFCGVAFGAVTAFILANLAGNRSVANAPEADKQAALSRTAPADRALLFVYREGFVAKLAGMNVSVDGKGVAQLKSPRFTSVSLAPGAHRIEAQFGGLAGAQSKTGELNINAAAGAILAVRITLSMGLVKGGIVLTEITDTALARRAMNAMPMVAPDVAEI